MRVPGHGEKSPRRPGTLLQVHRCRPDREGHRRRPPTLQQQWQGGGARRRLEGWRARRSATAPASRARGRRRKWPSRTLRSRCVVIDGDLDTGDTVVVIDTGILRLSAALDLTDTLEDIRL